MSFSMGRTLLLLLGISLLTVARPATGQEKKRRRITPVTSIKAILSFSQIRPQPSRGADLDQAHVKLKRTDGDALTVDVEKDGRYCIRYPPGSDIERLSFEAGEITCVERTSGSHSHYINKVLDNNCAQFGGSFTSLGPNTAAPVLTAAVIKKFGVLQVALWNTSGGTLQIVSFQFEHQTAKQAQSAGASDVIVPVDPDMVELVAARQKSSVCLLCGSCDFVSDTSSCTRE